MPESNLPRVRRRYCKDEEEHQDMQHMANFLVNVEWSREEENNTDDLARIVCML